MARVPCLTDWGRWYSSDDSLARVPLSGGNPWPECLCLGEILAQSASIWGEGRGIRGAAILPHEHHGLNFAASLWVRVCAVMLVGGNVEKPLVF